MDTLKTIAILATSVVMIWMSAAIVAIATQNSTVESGAAILAFLSTLSLGLVIALNSIDERHNAELRKLERPREKAKRESAPAEDARLALLLSLQSEEERTSLKHHLINDLTVDGETLSLAELLAAQDAENSIHARR